MKLSTLLSLAIVALAATSMQSASAQETRGARFNYAPNIWKAEKASVPKGFGEHADIPHNVQSGAVPSHNMLGLDPSFLEKPPAPVPQVAARPATTSLTPRLFVPKTNASFNPAFGRPQGVVAQSLPAAMPAPVPMVAKPQVAMTKPATAPAQVAKVHHPSYVHTGVSGRLRTPHLPSVVPASATPSIASYGPGVGFLPGAYLPGNGKSASTGLSGRLLTNIKHH
jgi:hypothetical protein